MEKNGFIKLHRKITEWEWYTHETTFRVFFHLLISANYEDKKWRGKIIKRGQLVTTQENLARALKILDTKGQPKRQPIRTALANLQKTGEITINSTNKYSIITINNYNTYQLSNQQKSNKLTNKQPTKPQQTNQRATTTKEYKELKEDIYILYSSLQNAYNTHCPSLPKCTKITDQRKRMIDARLKDYSEEDFIKVFKNAEASDFLSGRSGKWNGCNFDWLIKPNNFVKVLEGTYTNPKSKKQKNTIQSHEYDFKDLEKRLNKTTRGKK